MQKVKIVMFFCAPLFPVNNGTKRLITGLARYLNSLPYVHLVLAAYGDESLTSDSRYREICSECIAIVPPSRWGMFSVINKIISRCGIDMLTAFFTALAVRRSFVKICKESDYVLINYTVWFPLVPRRMRAERCAVITHDLVYYRRASFGGTKSVAKRLLVWLNRHIELSVLNSFSRTCVLADYEKVELLKYGFPPSKIDQIGFPMIVDRSESRHDVKEYDFAYLGGGDGPKSEAAVECFFSRVASLFPNRKLTFVMTRKETWHWNRISVPQNVELIKMGFVNSVSELLSKVRVGVATLPMGSGVKTKAVEMIMNDLPIVATNHGIEGIPICEDGVVNIDVLSDECIRRRIAFWLDNPLQASLVGARQGENLRRLFAPENCLKPVLKWMNLQ